MNEYLESFKKNISTEDAFLFEEYEKTVEADIFKIKSTSEIVEERIDYTLTSAVSVGEGLENLKCLIDCLNKVNAKYSSLFFTKEYDSWEETDYLCIKGVLNESYSTYSDRVNGLFLEYKKQSLDYQLYLKLKQQFEGC